jgi:hypothetical protein
MAGAINNADNHTSEHPTPVAVIEAARKVLGGKIWLDPASNLEFNKVVKAAWFIDKQKNGLEQHWILNMLGGNTIFLNPPGSQTPKGEPKAPSCHEWLDKLIMTLEMEKSIEAIYIGYNAPETLSRRPQHCRRANAILWTSVEGTATKEEGFLPSSGRIKFASDRPYFPSCILYFGKNVELFYVEFKKFGTFIEVL